MSIPNINFDLGFTFTQAAVMGFYTYTTYVQITNTLTEY